MDHNPATIVKLRRIQIGIFALYVMLIIAALAYFTFRRDVVFALLGALFVCSAFEHLLSSANILRSPIEDLLIRSIAFRSLHWLDWLMVGLFMVLTLAQARVLTVYESGHWQAPLVLVPFLCTAVLAPLVTFGWMLDRSTRRLLFAFIRSGFRFPPPEDDFWDSVRGDRRESVNLSLVSVVFFACILLQSLMLAIWEGSAALLLIWGIGASGMLTHVPLAQKPEPIEP